MKTLLIGYKDESWYDVTAKLWDEDGCCVYMESVDDIVLGMIYKR